MRLLGPALVSSWSESNISMDRSWKSMHECSRHHQNNSAFFSFCTVFSFSLSAFSSLSFFSFSAFSFPSFRSFGSFTLALSSFFSLSGKLALRCLSALQQFQHMDLAADLLPSDDTNSILVPHLHLLFQMLQLPVVDVDLSVGLTCNQAVGDYAKKLALKNHAKEMMKRWQAHTAYPRWK